MAGSTKLYAQGLLGALSGEINSSSDQFMVALVGSSYTPDTSTDASWNDISSHEVSGSGYTAGGQSLGPIGTNEYATSGSDTWPSNAFVFLNEIFQVGNAFFLAVQGGTSGTVEPTWPTAFGATVTDGTVVWMHVGESQASLYSNLFWISWPSATFSANYAVIYDATPSSKPLIALVDFGGELTTNGADFYLYIPGNLLQVII